MQNFSTKLYTDFEVEIQKPLCYDMHTQYFSSYSFFQIISMAFSYLVVINAVWMRMVLIWIAQKLRLRNRTKETSFIVLTIFYMNLVNFGLVQFLAPWDSREAKFEAV